jgi:hypothetical protein
MTDYSDIPTTFEDGTPVPGSFYDEMNKRFRQEREQSEEYRVPVYAPVPELKEVEEDEECASFFEIDL